MTLHTPHNWPLPHSSLCAPPLPGILALQQVSVGGDLLLQPSLDVQQDLVLLVLSLHLAAELTQLGLQAADEPLNLLQLRGIAALRLRQRALQPRFLVG